jgi:zinc transport system substrate-binding protein
MNSRRKKQFPLAAIFLAVMTAFLALLIFWPENRPAADAGAGGNAARVGATMFPLYDIAKNVAGDAVEVILITPPGASPHTFEPRPSDLRRLQGAAAVYAIGHGIDDWVGEMARGAGAAPVVVDRGVEILKAAGEEIGDDPHYWLDISNAKKMAATIADDLASRFPQAAGQFRLNLKSYLAQLVQADGRLKASLGGLVNKNIVTLHDAWYYFARAYDLNVAGSFEPTAGREPTPQYLIALQTAVARGGVRTIYSEPQLSTQGLESFVRDNGLNIAVLDPIGGIEGRDSYIKMMTYNARVIQEKQQ